MGFSQMWPFACCFLDAIFTKPALSCRKDGKDIGGIESLADSNKRYAFGVTAGKPGRGCDTVLHILKGAVWI